jgi:hypothetical protein
MNRSDHAQAQQSDYFVVAVQMKTVAANIDGPTRGSIKATVASCADPLVRNSPGSQNQNARSLDE